MRRLLATVVMLGVSFSHSASGQQIEKSSVESIPDKVVVLTFDDSVKSHFTIVRPILLKYRFNATFYITEGFDFAKNKKDYMTWEEIARLHKDGFEIGNHTRDHMAVVSANLEKLAEQVLAINRRCQEHKIPATTTFCYPANHFTLDALPILSKAGTVFARRGNVPEYSQETYHQGKGFAYQPGLDHPLLIPSTGIARPGWTLDDFIAAVSKARAGRIAVLQFHGVPDLAHPWVNTPIEDFEFYMRYLHDDGYTVLALRDLRKYVDPTIQPRDPMMVIRDRQKSLADETSRDNVRTPQGPDDLRFWLENMVWHHGYDRHEVCMATGLTYDDVVRALEKFDIRPDNRPQRANGSPLKVLPYPGGRHPRIGFLDGAIRPQRDTKVSIFAPWNESSYVVLDVPEAIRRNDEKQHGLLYLAHTHVATMWSKQQTALQPVEWIPHKNGAWRMERRLPNGVAFGTLVTPNGDGVRLEMWLTNGSTEKLSNLRVQNCLLLKGMPDFDERSVERHQYAQPYAMCRAQESDRWVITAWEPCQRVWSNADCPCLHSDPQFPDCAPGETQKLSGWMSFYEGKDIASELRRIDQLGWRD